MSVGVVFVVFIVVVVVLAVAVVPVAVSLLLLLLVSSRFVPFLPLFFGFMLLSLALLLQGPS